MKKWSERLFDFLASLRLAVVIILSLLVISAVGTFYEARYDAETAQKLVYKSIYMYIVMGALAVNLIAVMIDRWPWKRHHTGFVLAHVGIVLLLVGSVLTQRLGIDGTMAFAIGDSNRYVTVAETEFAVYASRDGEGMARIFHLPVDFLLKPPNRYPVKTRIGEDELEVIEFVPYGLRQSQIVESQKASDGPAIRLQLQNPNVNVSQWLLKDPGESQAELNFGPAKVVLTDKKFEYVDGNVLVIQPGPNHWSYEIYTASKKGLSGRGTLKQGERVDTGWMGLQLTAIRLLPKAREVVDYIRKDRPNPKTRAAIKVRYQGEEHWLGLNSVLRLYGKDHMLWVNYANRRIDVGFPIQLTKFHIGRYQGTMRAASYESEVTSPEIGTVTISMNEPLHYGQFTFYQASFEQDETGKPTASILSVNYDPGLWIKYLGSFLIVFGSIVLFYFKRGWIRSKLEPK